MNYIINGTKLFNRNNINNTYDNFYELKMFSMVNSNDNTNLNNKSKRSNIDNTYRKNLDISSLCKVLDFLV